MSSSYYSDRNIRARLVEFLGGPSLERASAAYISTEGRNSLSWYDPRPVSQLWQCVVDGAEIARSLWDRRSLIAHLDMEYVNFDDPAAAYRHPSRAFAVQRPAVAAIKEILLSYGIAPLHLLSGRGHHFVWRIDAGSMALAALAMVGRVPETLAGKYVQPRPPHGEVVPPDLGAAFAGLGQAMEFLAHRTLAAINGRCEVPVELTAVEAGPVERDREIISLDLSEYGDPLYTRTTRMPFSAYAKPQRYATRSSVGHCPPMFVIPLHEMNERQALAVMRNAEQVRKLARCASVQIPDQSQGTYRLLRSYQQSRLARFHDEFYAAEHDPPAQWSSTYDRTPLDSLPDCVSRILRLPNDWLLKPAGIQHVVRTLLAVGWHPRHVAGLIRSKYERDYGWGTLWLTYDAAMRADFYVRLFSGFWDVGLDKLIDFNCRSTQEKKYCCSSGCSPSLEHYRQQLLDRRRRSATNSGADASPVKRSRSSYATAQDAAAHTDEAIK